MLSAAVLMASLLQGGGVAAAYPASHVELHGAGWGHGRGMGQWGALGYALDAGWSYEQILNHFYSNTAMGTISNIPMSVRLMRFDGRDTLVQQERGRMSIDGISGTHNAIRVSRTGSDRFRVDRANGCAGPWTTLQSNVTGPVNIRPTHRTGERQDMLQVCEPDGTQRWLRNDIEVRDTDDGQQTVNHVLIEQYLLGVVPRESPASWGNLGGGAGMHALRAQAVAARSYAAIQNRRPYAKTCDTTACQVYGGVAIQRGGTFTQLEHANTTTAIQQTAGQVRRFTSNNAIASTEYSSSTGGWTAGGAFPAVRDDGDSVCRSDACNPNHRWQASIPVSKVEEAWPEIGRLEAFRVTSRNGHGAWGGRVLQVRIEGTNRTITPAGHEVRSKLGLRSNWFTTLDPSGYWVVAEDGGIFAFGNAHFHGSMGGERLDRPIVGMAATPSGNGYWMVASDGGIFSFGGARFRGSMGGQSLVSPMVGMAPTSSGRGYWTVAADGGLFAFGDAGFFGSMGDQRLDRPIVGMAATPSGNGYWMVASDGGIFAFGDAEFYGSMGGRSLVSPMVGMTPTRTGRGYWTVAADGGIFSFGDARFRGSMGGKPLDQPITGMARTESGRGYWLVATDGGVFAFGDGVFWGSVPGVAPASRTRKVGIAPSPVTG